MDREFSEKTIQHVSKKLDADIDELKNYINTYSLLPVLEKAFINDNFIYEKQKGVPNEDFLISDYIADLYLSFQINRETKEPLQDDVNRIFEVCMDIVSSSMTIEILSFFRNKYKKDDSIITILENIEGILFQLKNKAIDEILSTGILYFKNPDNVNKTKILTTMQKFYHPCVLENLEGLNNE